MDHLFPKNYSHTEMPPSFMEYTQRKNGYTKQTETERKTQDSLPKNTTTHKAIGEALELSNNLEKKPGSLFLVSDFVTKNREAKIRLPDNEVMKDINVRICGLDGTMYSGKKYMLERWKGLYLPEPTEMEVLGVLESSEGVAPFLQYIVLVGKDGHVYGYEDEDEVLYQFASNLKEMLQDGIKPDTYYDYPDDISDEEEEVLQQDENIQKLREETKKFIDDDAEEFNEFMNFYFNV
ncbi:uncharacterized protein LOC143935169 [Lithobates pipiens]